MGIFEENLAKIEMKNGNLAEKIREIDINKKMQNVGIVKASNGMEILQVCHEGRQWNLNSSWNPEIAAEVYAERYAIRLYGVYFVFGFSDGRVVREMLKKCDETNLLVICEPNLETFALACHYFDIRDLVEEKRVLIFFSELEREMENVLAPLLDYARMNLIEFCILPNYDSIYHDVCEQFMDSVIERMRAEIVNKATHLTFNRAIPQHRLFHMRNLIYQRNLEQLKLGLAAHDLTEIPAIIVSAGPSLDKNIHLLKEARGKAFIMAVDASIRTVIRSGVYPDILCSIDPNSPERFFDGLNLENVFWSCTGLSSPDILKKYANHIFYHGSFYKPWNQILEKECGYPFPTIVSGGSVSTEAFMIALYLGFRKIILIGQDLAFTGGISHTKGVEDALGDNDEYIKRRHIVEVEGIDGQMLETDFQMWYYKQWLEKVIRINREAIRVIDATEGGARIEGTEIRAFGEVITNECKKELDIYQILKQIQCPFSTEKQQELLEELKKIKQTLVVFEGQLADTIAWQQQQLALLKKENTTTQQMTGILLEVSGQNEKIEKEPLLELVSMYAQKEEYEIGDQIYTEEKMDPCKLVEKSLTLLKGYQNGAKLLEEDVDEFIMKD